MPSTLVIPVGFCQVGLEMIQSGDPEPQYITFGVDSSAADDDPIVVATAIYGAANGTIDSVLNAAYSFTGVTVKVGQATPPPLGVYVPFPEPIDGIADTPMLPQNSAYLMKKSSATPGRRGKGRMYFPGVAEGVVNNNGSLTNAEVSSMSAAFGDFLQVLNDGNPLTPSVPCPMVLLHGTGDSDVPAPSVVTQIVCDRVIATQRRRLRP